MQTMTPATCATFPNTVISSPGPDNPDLAVNRNCFTHPKGVKIPIRLPGKALVTVDFHQGGTPDGMNSCRRARGPRTEVARILELAGYQMARKPDPGTVRFNIGLEGTKRIQEHRRERQYQRMLRETSEFATDLRCAQDDDGDWVIALDQDDNETIRAISNDYWTTRAEAEEYLMNHEEEVRMDYLEGLFSRGECTQCSNIVLVLGNYVPYDPAGMLWCSGCLSDLNEEPTPAGIVR